jgi:WD40 repeat protein
MKRVQQILELFFIFFLISCSMATPNIRLNAGGVEMELIQPVPIPMIAPGNITSDGKYFLTGGWKEQAFKLWDISTGAQINKFNTETAAFCLISAVSSPNGKYALSTGKNLKLWDLSSGKEIKTLDDSNTRHISSFSSDGSRVASLTIKRGLTHVDFNISLWDAVTWNNITRFKLPDDAGFPQSLALSPDGRYILLGGMPHKPIEQMFNSTAKAKMVLMDAATGEVLKTVIASEGSNQAVVFSVAFSPDGKHALSAGMDNTVRLWDIPSGTEIKRIKAHSSKGIVQRGAFFVTFSPNSKYFLSGGGDGLLKLWDASTGAEIRSFGGFSGSASIGVTHAVGYAAFLPDGKHIVSAAADGAVRIWDISSGEEIALFFGFEDGEWLVITEEGYYNSSEKGAQYLKVKFEGKEYTVDQFYDVFYRPDIVTAKLGGQDISELVSITMKDARKYPPPLIESVSQSPGNDQYRSKVCYKIKSTGGGIGEVRLFHNGKLIQSDGYYKEIARPSSDRTQLTALDSKAIYEDMRKISIKGKAETIPIASKSKGELFEDCQEIYTVPGDNEVSITAFNSSNTVQSYMKTINFNSKMPSEDPRLYILAIGTDQYKDNSVNLKYAVKDAKDIEDKLKTQAATLYKGENIHYELLTDGEATKPKITNKIERLAKTIKPQDSFILFVAGHGTLLQNQYYMLTHDFDGTVDNNSMISSNEIVEMSKKIRSLSQLFIFDTCHAGGVDTIVSGLYDARMSVLAKKMGLHIYASANDKQAAMDGYKGNGLFTYTLLDGLNNNKEADKNRDGRVTVVGLGEYSKKMTTNISKEIGHAQTPLIINFGKDSPIYKLQ